MFGGIKNMPPRVGWSTFIRQIILSDDVNIIHRSKHFDWQEGWDWEPDVKWANIDVRARRFAVSGSASSPLRGTTL